VIVVHTGLFGRQISLSVSHRLNKEGKFHTDDAKVLREAVTDKHTAQVYKQSELFVSDFERDEGMARDVRIEIAGLMRDSPLAKRAYPPNQTPKRTFDTREFGDIV
jgi:hypothetical protein